MKSIKKALVIVIILFLFHGCSDFIDVVPDNIATIEEGFRTRSAAERYLFTLYSYLPKEGKYQLDPSLTGGDELWLPTTAAVNSDAWLIARGNQRVVDPYMNFWQGAHGGSDLYEGIRQTNIFLQNISSVNNMEEYEKRRWAAEAKFLKAYYHFYLVRMYGPIVVVKENKPVFSNPDEVEGSRAPVDDTFDYIIELLDEAIKYLPESIDNEATELGRITKGIALSMKAKVLVTAASPLFNGNKDYNGFTNKQGNQLFNTEFDPSKWDSAANAAKKAIEFVTAQGKELYEFEQDGSAYQLSDTTITKMSIRNSVTRKWNSGIIWGNTNSMVDIVQKFSTPRGLDPTKRNNLDVRGFLSPPLKIAEMFYSSNGVPITEDKTWSYSERFDIKTATYDDRYNLKEGYKTAKLNFDREPRFYASLGFDGGIWYGQGHNDDDGNDLLFLSSKKGQPGYKINIKYYSITGYYPKKLVNYNSVITNFEYIVEPYPWPVLRLADLYLLYAEALNESEGPNAGVYKYLNLVRKRAGIPTVEDAWSNYSTNPTKYTTKSGLRDIIHHERLIELAFEGKRFWDLRRWKKASETLNQPITGWDLDESDPDQYYRERTVFDQRFNTRDYLWPISERELLQNNGLKQNPGW